MEVKAKCSVYLEGSLLPVLPAGKTYSGLLCPWPSNTATTAGTVGDK